MATLLWFANQQLTKWKSKRGKINRHAVFEEELKYLK